MSAVTGQCLCGAVQAIGRGTADIAICHCKMCQRWHGGPSIAVNFSDGIQVVAGEDALAWYRSSDWAERGFCKTCGSTMFYRVIEALDELSGEGGSFDLPDGLPIREHYFIDEKPDYYDFKDDARRVTGAEVMARYGMSPEGKSI